MEFAQVLHCIAVRKLSPLPLNPVIPARHALRLTLSFPPSCHFERSEKSSSRYTLTLSSPPIMSFRAQREIFPFSLFLPLSPLNAWDPARAAHAGPIHVCSQCHAPVPVSRGDARGNPGAPVQGGLRFQACRRPRGSGSIPPKGRELDLSRHTCYHSRKTPFGVWARAPWTAEHVGKGSQPSREEVICPLLLRVVSGSWSPAW